jgi:hypothetical protein
MTRLEDLQPKASVRGILPDSLVTVVNVQWFGSEALELTYKDPLGRLANELLYRHDEPRLEVVEQGRPWSFDGDGHLFRLVSEAHGNQGFFSPALSPYGLLLLIADPCPIANCRTYLSVTPSVFHDRSSKICEGRMGASALYV